MSPQQTISPRAWLELFLLSAIWGASFLAIRIALDEISFLWVVAHRVGWAALILWIIAILRREALPGSLRLWGACFVMGLLNNVIPFSLMAWGQQHIETGLTSILNATTAIFAVLVAAMVFADERLTARRAFGVGLGFLGVATAVGIASLAAFDLRSASQVAVLAGALSYAFAGAWARRKLSGLSPIVAAAAMLTGSTLMAWPAAWIMDGAPDLSLSTRTWSSIAYYSVAATAVAYLLYYRILAMAGSGNLLLCTLMIPPVAILLGALVLGEALAPRAFLGFAILSVGLLVLDGRIVTRLRGWISRAPAASTEP